MQDDGILKMIICLTSLFIYVYQQHCCLPFSLSLKNMASNNKLCIYYLSFKDILTVVRVAIISKELVSVSFYIQVESD